MTGKKKTLFQKLQNVKSKYCASKATVTDVKAAGKVYVADAVAKGKPKAEAEASVARVLASSCPIAVSGTRRPTTRRRATAAAPRAAPRRKATTRKRRA